MRTAVAFTIVFLLLTCTPLELWWMSRLESAWTDRIPAVILVLGGEEQGPGLIGYSTYLRLTYATRFWREGKVRMLVVSGGPGDPARRTEPLARAMKNYLIGQGIPASNVLEEPEAQNTRENFAASKPIMDGLTGEKGFLTSDYHSGRAAGVCLKMGLNWRPVPISDARKRWNNRSERWPLAMILAEESLKSVWYRRRGWI